MRVCKDKKKHTWSWGYEDARISTNTHEPEGMRMWGCDDASTWEYDISMWVYENTTKYTGTWLYEDMRIQDASKNMWTSGYKDVRMSTSTHELYRVWGCKYVRMPKSTHKAEAMRIWRCEDTSKHTWTWRYEDIRMREHTHEPECARKHGGETCRKYMRKYILSLHILNRLWSILYNTLQHTLQSIYLNTQSTYQCA